MTEQKMLVVIYNKKGVAYCNSFHFLAYTHVCSLIFKTNLCFMRSVHFIAALTLF